VAFEQALVDSAKRIETIGQDSIGTLSAGRSGPNVNPNRGPSERQARIGREQQRAPACGGLAIPARSLAHADAVLSA
jgi:hypothetical protein